MDAPYTPQDVQDVSRMLEALESAGGQKRHGGHSVKKTTFRVKGSETGIHIDSWRMQEWDYKRPDLPTYARGLFTTLRRGNEPEIAVRGYDKFFNVNEVNETKWDNIISRTQPPYELTLKENGCIIFVAGLEDGTLVVCSKHSTGDRNDTELSHASAGEKRLERQLAALGKTKADLARELRRRNVTAVAELCDDTFEEHILQYGPERAGLYLHGMNLNLPEFATYPSSHVQKFADEWGFRKTGLIVMNDVQQVKSFLEEVAQTGAHGGRDVEGFVIRCKMSLDPATLPFTDWFFKYKFEEPYLMYRQWRECTKALIAGKPPRFKKHIKITEEYLLYARRRLAADPQLGKLYNQNHGIISLRDEFLKFKNLNGADAANMDSLDAAVMPDVTRDVILCPIATIGCGKTTIALALVHLFGWGHVQNDNITGKGRPPKFTKAVLDQLKDKRAVIADRNNALKHERKQILTDAKLQHANVKLVCLNFRHDEDRIDEIRQITRERVLERGDNHQTIHAASDKDKFLAVMEGFVNRFEPCNPYVRPDDGFDLVIDLDPTVGSRSNLATTVKHLNQSLPGLVEKVPTEEELDAAIEVALGYKPEFTHDITERQRGNKEQKKLPQRKRNVEYVGVTVPSHEINTILDKTFGGGNPQQSRFYMQLKQTRRIQPQFHVTLIHRAMSATHPDLWQRYMSLHEAAGGTDEKLGECRVMLERIVHDDRIMCIVVRLIDEDEKWECVNRVAHITIGTRDTSVKPKESNDLLAKWLEVGASGDGGITEIIFDEQPILNGTAKVVLSR
ncbi:hypothetical protein S40288_06590 [Stachybotrys chartarum IBT 40288]|nr:hypothetical protein S40288_06590 [Stachybotrys chartarum IBT 40288]